MPPFEPTQVSAESLRKMLHFIAADLGIDDPDCSVNPVTLTRQIREAISYLPNPLKENEE